MLQLAEVQLDAAAHRVLYRDKPVELSSRNSRCCMR